ncbi:hypothetical protein [Kitasatospora sp. NPDC058190]|uniref:hypothetical protein n=1 Tax=Kitasatospora sp. NPDC058190 TaxID=3346371 RepID=UPI0036DC4BB4
MSSGDEAAEWCAGVQYRSPAWQLEQDAVVRSAFQQAEAIAAAVQQAVLEPVHAAGRRRQDAGGSSGELPPLRGRW